MDMNTNLKIMETSKFPTPTIVIPSGVQIADSEIPEAKNNNFSGSKKRKRKNTKTETKGKRGKENKFKVAFTNRRVTRQMSRSANNELSKGELSCLTDKEKLQLTSWGLPVSVIAKYKSKGVTSLFPWQLECLGNVKVLEGRNLLYSAPTSAGKTLVAEILMVKRVLELGKKAIMILPFVSVCREKMFSLQEIFGDAGVRVEGFMGAYNPPGGFKSVDIAICTIEKANSLINRLLEEKSLSQLGTIVVDELHLIGDPHRGYLLELLLTKIKFMTTMQRLEDISMSEDETKESKKLNLQIIGMSATLPNLELLSSWIDGELVITDYRPVPLVERILFGDKIYDPLLQPVRDVQTESLQLRIKGDDNRIVYLSLETVLAGHSVLIFCPTKANCETLAKQIAMEFYNIGNPENPTYPEIGESLRKQLNSEKIRDMLAQLNQCPGGMDDVLKKTVSFAVAFHHAGLTYDERDIIESSFKRGVLRVIVATSTLSAGVNLPARRVIVSTPLFNRGILDVLTYRQMCGRAGRKGVDTEGKIKINIVANEDEKGESILICTNETKGSGVTLVQSSLPCVKSALLGDQGALTSSMKRALLEVIASGIATHPVEVEKYSKCTLLSRTIDLAVFDNQELPTSQEDKDATVAECLQFLVDNDFIRLQRYESDNKPDEYMATQLGSACLASSLAPDEGIIVYKELEKARKCFVLGSELHVVYQVTPIYLSDQLRTLPWVDYLDIWNELDADEKLVANLVGIDEAFIMRNMIGTIQSSAPKHKEKLMVHHRFFVALALNDLVNEMSISAVGKKYSLNKGVIQSIQQSASTFAGMVTAFCGRLGWSNLELLLSQFQERLQFGVQRELCDMVRLSTMNGQRARILYDNGIKTVAELAAADPAEVESILHKAVPFLSSVHGEGQIQRNVWMLGKTGLSESEAAQNIVEEARQFIQIELGLDGDLQFLNTAKPPDSQSSSSQRQVKKPSKHDLLGESESSEESADQKVSSEDEEESKIMKLANIQSKQVGMVKDTRVLSTVISPLPNYKSPNRGEAKSRNNTYDSVFDDSFVIGSQDMFGDLQEQELQLKSNIVQCVNGPTNENPSPQDECNIENNDDQMEMDTSGFMEMIVNELMETSMETSDKEYEKTPKNRRKATGDGSIKHSTPVLESCVSNFKKRLSAIVPGPLLDHEQEHAQILEIDYSKAYTDTLNGTWGGANDEFLLLAELDTFNSVASLMEVSLNISGANEPLEKENEDPDKIKNAMPFPLIPVIAAKDSDPKFDESFPKLSDSINAAMLAMMDDSKPFHSEDLFSDFEKPENPSPSPAPNVTTNRRTLLTNNGIRQSNLNFSNEKISCPAGLESSLESDPDIFEISSEYESTSSWTGQSSARNASSHEPIMSANIGGQLIKVMKVLAPEFIPPEIFDATNPIGIGMKLVPAKRPSSIAKCGIGARIVSPKPTARVVGEEVREHSITLYNGGNTIWVFQWKHSDNQMIRHGRMHPFLNIQAKLGDLFKRLRDSGTAIVLFDSKEKLKKILNFFGKDLITKFPSSSRIWDPKIAQWMWQFHDDLGEISSNTLIEMHLDKGKKEITGLGWGREIMDPFIAYHVIQSLKKKLQDNKLWDHFTETEMPSIMPIMLMEMNGFGLDSKELSRMKEVLQFKSALLEIQAYQLAGRQFNLNSPKDIRQILFREIGLKQPTKCTGTGKDVLSRLDHELPQIIIEWRKIDSALRKVVVPFRKEKNLDTGRVHGFYSHFTVTGRVVMYEPSLQCIPRDFDLIMDFTPLEIEDIKSNCKIKFGSKLSSLLNQIDKGFDTSQNFCAGVRMISMRNVFVPCCEEFVLVAADYSQLELRILAHLSGDKGLLTALNAKAGDVFISIASQWKKLPASQITNSVRQEVKGIVYGVIYGMGVKTLAEQMEVDEAAAKCFISEFLAAYPDVERFRKKTLESCRKVGYIETISGRRRYLPQINSKNPIERAQAERQAINSRIQGSAADLMKKAMTNIHNQMCQTFPDSFIPIDWNKFSKVKRSSQTTSSFNSSIISKVVYFPILNLHDELIFEVRKSHISQVAAQIRNQMESSLKLSVRLPVVIKSGSSWGSLEILE